MIKNLLNNTYPTAVHAPGNLKASPMWLPIYQKLFNNQYNKSFPQNVTIITWNSNTKNHRPLGIVEKSLKHLNVQYTNLGNGLKWNTNRLKITLTLEYLKTVKTPYVLGMDSCDVLLLPNYENLVEKFEQLNVKLIYNAERMYWPPDYREDLKDFEITKAYGIQRHLNCGLWMGEINFCIDFLTEALKNSQNIEVYQDSEQVCIKPLYPKYYPLVQVDYRCVLFQNLHRLQSKHIQII